MGLINKKNENVLYLKTFLYQGRGTKFNKLDIGLNLIPTHLWNFLNFQDITKCDSELVPLNFKLVTRFNRNFSRR